MHFKASLHGVSHYRVVEHFKSLSWVGVTIDQFWLNRGFSLLFTWRYDKLEGPITLDVGSSPLPPTSMGPSYLIGCKNTNLSYLLKDLTSTMWFIEH